MYPEWQETEIIGSKSILSALTDREILYFAYPGGEYNHDTLKSIRTAGFEAALAIIPQKLGMEPRFEVGRIGVYSQSLFKLQMKTIGLADLGRSFGLRVG
jgi:peptidoglycan/xylan/chitin deacetylase (PgdA/CDA1 family)